ncbi:hypothetical protein ES705_29542 [subsurface metagenome]
MDYTWLVVGLSLLFSLYFTYYYVGRVQKETRITLNDLGSQLTEGIKQINSDLEPVHNAVSRSMGAISSVADNTKMEKALDRRIGLDTLDQYGDIVEGIRMAFPRVAEYIDERPEAITKLLPRLNTLINDPDTRKRLNLDLSGKSSDLNRIWREE